MELVPPAAEEFDKEQHTLAQVVDVKQVNDYVKKLGADWDRRTLDYEKKIQEVEASRNDFRKGLDEKIRKNRQLALVIGGVAAFMSIIFAGISVLMLWRSTDRFRTHDFAVGMAEHLKQSHPTVQQEIDLAIIKYDKELRERLGK